MNVTSGKDDISSKMDGGAFGAGKSGGPFDPMLFVRKPQVIVRLVSLVSSYFVLYLLQKI